MMSYPSEDELLLILKQWNLHCEPLQQKLMKSSQRVTAFLLIPQVVSQTITTGNAKAPGTCYTC